MKYIYIDQKPKHVYCINLFSDKTQYIKQLEELKISKINAENRILIDKDRYSFFLINKSTKYTDIHKICETIGSLNENICISLYNLSADIKPIFLTYLTKHLYEFDRYLPKKQQHKVYIYDNQKDNTDIKNLIHIINSTEITRNLQNEPANRLPPSMFVNRVKKIFKDNQHIKTKVLDTDDMKKEGLNLILAIGESSIHKPRFLLIEYIRNKSAPTVCLVGKTVIYDTGGLNIKFRGMDVEMKTDKSGGSTVVGIMKYFADINATNINIIGLLPIVVNELSNRVAFPGDIFKAYNGQTVEIVDTDAEGRVIMADALSYCKNYNPDYIIDLATLTGWSNTVHRDLCCVCFTSNHKLMSLTTNIGNSIGERAWFLPPWTEYKDMIKSNVADVKNYSDHESHHDSGTFSSLFLYNFVPHSLKNKYLHVDICNNFKNELARGNCVIMIIELLRNLITD